MIKHRTAYFLQEIFQTHPFLMSRNFETHDCQCYGVKRITSIFVGNGNSVRKFGAPLYYLKYISFLQSNRFQAVSLPLRLVKRFCAFALVERVG